jgi:MerR family transcriptional regulator, thiopeptide resistance regulator
VLALKSFGLPLGRIAELLSGRCADLADFLALHEDVLRQRQSEVTHALALVSAARARLSGARNLSSDDLIDLTRETVMTQSHNQDMAAAYDAITAKHLSADDRAALAANGYRGMAEPDDDWPRLNAEAARLMQDSRPDSPEAMDLARRWMGKVFEGTGGDPALTAKMKAVAREAHEHPSFARHAPQANAIMDFVASAYGAAIAAGIMPDPRTSAAQD